MVAALPKVYSVLLETIESSYKILGFLSGADHGKIPPYEQRSPSWNYPRAYAQRTCR